MRAYSTGTSVERISLLVTQESQLSTLGIQYDVIIEDPKTKKLHSLLICLVWVSRACLFVEESIVQFFFVSL